MAKPKFGKEMTEILKLRITPQQKSIVANDANKSGDTMSDYIRKQLKINNVKEEPKEEKGET